jgi:DMSO/TMAO reductase YedYZ molybdopterin-dependent catalytic subunit
MPQVHDDPKYQLGDPPRPDDLPDPTVVVSPDTRRAERIPPGQSRTRKWPVLHYGYVPGVPLVAWRFRVTGLVRSPFTLAWDDFRSLPRVKVFADFHCVTQWSRLGNLWEGVRVRDLLDRAEALPTAKFAIIHGYDSGWTTNLPLSDLLADDVLLADTHDGEPLSADHGGPVRLVVPSLYAWKSAKWAREIELVADDTPGYWEQGGYHMRGDPWREERYGGR